jgi:uncharacterized protein YwqG
VAYDGSKRGDVWITYAARAVLGTAMTIVIACNDPMPTRSPPRPKPTSLPAEMAEYEAAFRASALDYAAIEARKKHGTKPWESKFLGTPYLPLDMEYPVDADGTPLRLLAQINFAEVPELADFPTHGIVQFFIAPGMSRRHVWGMAADRDEPYSPRRYFDSLQKQDYFRVLYHADVTEDADRLRSDLPPLPQDFLPIDSEARLSFSRKSGYVLMNDYRFEKVFGARVWEFFERFGEKTDEVWEAYADYTHEYALAKIGGYGEFVQGDPRLVVPDQDWVVLLEIDSAGPGEEIDVLWGDAGIANFLIERSALQRRDFSKVVYYWDNS